LGFERDRKESDHWGAEPSSNRSYDAAKSADLGYIRSPAGGKVLQLFGRVSLAQQEIWVKYTKH